MILLIGIIVILIMLCGAVVSTKAISKRSKDDATDEVYRDNYRYRNQYREDKEDAVNIDLPKEEEIEETAQQPIIDEVEEKQESEQKTVVAPGEDIKK